jgi:hypothetical protein
MLKKILAVVVAGLGFVASQVFALAPATLADLTTGISFADVGLAILAVAALMITVYVVKKGAMMVIHAVKSM